MSAQGGPALKLSLQFADPRHRSLLARHRVARWLRVALAGPAEITVRMVDAQEGLALNRQFRGQDHATNVLTFDYAAAPLVVADLVLCAEVVEREALSEGKPLLAHYAHLVVHGALHAQGMDHQAACEARLMQRRESEILCSLGFADPWLRSVQRPQPAPGRKGAASGKRTKKAPA